MKGMFFKNLANYIYTFHDNAAQLEHYATL